MHFKAVALELAGGPADVIELGAREDVFGQCRVIRILLAECLVVALRRPRDRLIEE